MDHSNTTVKVALFAIITLSISLFQGDFGLLDYLALKKTEETLKQTIGELEEQNEIVKAEIDRIKSSPLYARKVLRDKYHVTEQGEHIIFFTE